MQLDIQQFELKLKQTFTTSHGSVDKRDSFIVSITEDGFTGLGECVVIKYYQKSIDHFTSELQNAKKYLMNDSLDVNDQLANTLIEVVPDRFILCALDLAIHDLIAKKEGCSIRSRLGLPFNCSTSSTLTIGICEVEEALSFIKKNPWPIYKVKLGTDKDIAVIEAINKPLR